MRDQTFEPNELQKALLGYDPKPLEEELLKWTRDHWAMAARGQVYCKKEAMETILGVQGIYSDEGKRVLEVAARIAIAQRELMCRAVAAVVPQWLEETYGITLPEAPAEA